MGSIRKKWTEQEDEILMKILKDETCDEETNWDLVAKEMEDHNFNKSAKQCRERWLHQLNPTLKKDKWNKKENKQLFILFQKIGCKWKEIAEHFKGRTDNSIKNQFFSLIRKSLRTARKLLEKHSNTALINQMKPKVLAEFLKKTIIIPIPIELRKYPQEIQEEVRVVDFIQEFVFIPFQELQSQRNDRFTLKVTHLIQRLIKDNNTYLNCKKNKNKFHNKKDQIKEEQIRNSKITPKVSLQKINIIKSNTIPMDNTKQIEQSFQEILKLSESFKKMNEFYYQNPQEAGSPQSKHSFCNLIKSFGDTCYKLADVYQQTSNDACIDFYSVKNIQNKKFFPVKTDEFSLYNSSKIQVPRVTVQDPLFLRNNTFNRGISFESITEQKNIELPETNHQTLSNLFIQREDSSLIKGFVMRQDTFEKDFPYTHNNKNFFEEYKTQEFQNLSEKKEYPIFNADSMFISKDYSEVSISKPIQQIFKNNQVFNVI